MFNKMVLASLFLTIGLLFSGLTLMLNAQGRDLTGSKINSYTQFYEAGASDFVLEFDAEVISSDWESVPLIEMQFPAGITVTSATNMTGSYSGLTFNGQSGDGALLSWGVYPGIWGNTIYAGDVAQFSVTVAIDAAFVGDISIAWTMNGDGWGVDPHQITGITVIQEIPENAGLEFLTQTLDLGERPIGAWTKAAPIHIVNNPGLGDFEIIAAEIDQNYQGFLQAILPADMPFVLSEGSESFAFGVGTTTANVNAGGFAGAMAFFFQDMRTLRVINYSGSAYLPEVGDVWENPFNLNQLSFPDQQFASSFKNNYDLPGAAADGWDVVYRIDATEDKLLNVVLTGDNVKMAFYHSGFEGVGGPDISNAYYSATQTATAVPVFSGTNYLVVSSSGNDFTLDVNETLMPAPGQANYISPSDGATDIINGQLLEWSWGANTLEYQVLLGTTYPPSTVVADWTFANTTINGNFALNNLNPNLQYFWQVNARNNNDIALGDIHGFTTSLTPPNNLLASITDAGENNNTVSVDLSWQSGNNRSFLGYNLYRDGIKINTEPLISENFVDLGVARDATFTYNITALYDEGESAFSNSATVITPGVGTLSGVITDQLTNDPVSGARILIQGANGTYDLNSDASGNYMVDAYAGDYIISVTAIGYQETGSMEMVSHDITTTADYTLLEKPYAVSFVYANELNENEVLLEWGFDLQNFVPTHHPFPTHGYNAAEIRKQWSSYLAINQMNNESRPEPHRALMDFNIWRKKKFLAEEPELIGTTSQMNYVDFDWAIQDWGVYEWYVEAVYEMETAEAIASNALPKDMFTSVAIEVNSNTGDPALGALVSFTNTSELQENGEPIFLYNTIITNEGAFVWEQFRKGIYDLQIDLFGHEPITLSGMEIFEPADLTYLLTEYVTPPTNLYVSPTALATWDPGAGHGGVGFEDYAEDFEEGIPEDWTIEYGANSNDPQNWKAVPIIDEWTPSVSGTNFVKISSGDAGYAGGHVHGLLYSPVMNTTGVNGLFIQFDQVYVHGGGIYVSLYANVDVFDGNQWVNVLNQTSSQGNWYYPLYPEWGQGVTALIDVSDYANPQFQVRFDYDDNNVWAYDWGIDDFSVTTTIPDRMPERQLVQYNVFLDSVLITSTDEEYYQYDVSVLTDGQYYTSEVVAIYTTGQSERSSYGWTYIACDNYAVAENFAADQIVGTSNVELNWELPETSPEADQIELIRIYRNGEILVELAETLAYVDENVAFGNYDYCLTLVYESGAETCLDAVCANVEVTGGAYVDGYVMQAEYLGGQAIEGASVILAGQTNSFTFVTDESGMYSGEVIGGLYTYTVSAEGYISEQLESIDVPVSATITQNFVLEEFPEPAIEVIAEEMADDLVKISWRSPGSMLYETVSENFDSGIAPGWTIEDGGNTTDSWMWLNSYDGGFSLDDSPMMMVNSDAAGPSDVLMVEYLYSATYNTNGASSLYLVFDQYYQHAGTGYASVEVFDGTTWVEVYNVSNTVGGWFSADQQQLDVTPYSNDQFQMRFFFTDNTSWGFWWAIDNVLLTDAPAREDMLLTPPQSSLQGYQVYRSSCYDTTDMELLGFVIDTNFFDYTWANMPAGVYKWAVEAVYAQNTSEPRFSNCLDKDMSTTVSVQIATNSGDLPEDVHITFTNISEAHLDLVYETITDETGYYIWGSFRKGEYDIMVTKNGFLPITLEAYEISEPEDFNWILEEQLIPVNELYVSPAGFASWVDGSAMPVYENEWTIHVFGNSYGDEISWELYNQADEVILTGGNYGFQFDDTQIITVLSTEEPLTFIIESQGTYGDNTANYELSCGGQLIYEDLILGNQEHILEGLSCNNSATTRTSLNFNDGTIRNPADYQHLVQQGVTQNQQYSTSVQNHQNGMRDIQYFKVWLDGVFIADTDDSFYQYSLDNLLANQVYLSEVAAVYANGMSAKMSYEWTYIPCENMNGPAQYTAEVINENDVFLSWTNMEPLELVKITQNPGAPSNGYFQEFNFGYGVAFDLEAYPDALINSINFHHASWGTTGTWDYMVHIYNWDDRSLIASFGPYQTSGNDTWENEIPLADIPAMGADMVAILIEPMGNLPTDAYPCISSDDATNPQGSVFGPLDDIQAVGSSTIGNFLLELYINTSYGSVNASPVEFETVLAPQARSKTARYFENDTPIITQQAGSSRSDDAFVGANLYRNGVLIAELLQDSSYLDENVNGGAHTYCLRYVYESGAMTCEDAYCLEVDVPCTRPENLVGEYFWTSESGIDEFGTLLRWEQATNFIEEWLYYDDGENVDGIGGPAAFQWAIKFDPDQLSDYEGASLTKIQIYNRTQATDELRIYQGPEAATLLYSQPLSGLAVNSWEEVELTAPVLIDVTQEFWIAVYTTDGVNYPAACGNTTGQLNGELLSIDGSVWEYLSDNGLPYTWNLRGFITTVAGATMALPMEKPNDQFDSDQSTELGLSGIGSVESNMLSIESPSRTIAAYNVYRSEDGQSYEQIASVPFDENSSEFEYFDSEVDAQQGYYYQITAHYVYEDNSSCESEPALALENQDDDFVYVFVTGQQEASSFVVKLYPNPAIGLVTIEANDIQRVIISNALGQVVFIEERKDSKIRLNTTNYQAGVYFVRLETASGISTKQLTIVK